MTSEFERLERLRFEAMFVCDVHGSQATWRTRGSPPAPRLHIARNGDDVVVRARADVAPRVVADARAIAASARSQWLEVGAVEQLLDEVRETYHGRAFVFAPTEPPTALPDPPGVSIEEMTDADRVHELFGESIDAVRPVVVASDGEIRSVCHSARRSSAAAEAGVRTSRVARGCGLASAVTARWSAFLTSSGMTPFFTTTLDNAPAVRVADRAGFAHFAEVLHVT